MRTVETLIATSMLGDEDDEQAWRAIRELHALGTQEVYEAATALLRSPVPKERWRGVDILAQLRIENASRCADRLVELIAHETHADVLNSLGIAFGHLHDARGADSMVAFKNHPDVDVRRAVAFTVTSVPALIELSADLDDDVRDWATFSLGSRLEEVDTPALRQALIARLTDSHDDTRREAMVGLAQRGDRATVEPVRLELLGPHPRVYAIESAGLLGDPSFLPRLRELRAEAKGEYVVAMLDEALERLAATTV